MATESKINAVVFDYPSFLFILFKYKFLKKVKRIVFYEGNSVLFKKKIKIIKRLLAALQIKNVCFSEIPRPVVWESNPAIVDYLDKNEHKINRALISRFKSLLKADEADVLKLVKKFLFNNVSRKFCIKKILEGSEDKQLVIVTDSNLLGIYDEVGVVWESNALQRLFYRLFMPPVAFSLVLLNLLKKFSLVIKRKKMVGKDLLIQVNHYGYEGEIAKDYSVLDYVFDKEKAALLFLDMWRPADETVVDKFKARLVENGVAFFDVRDFVLTFSELLRFLVISLREAVYSIFICKTINDLFLCFAFLKQYFSEYLTIENCRCRAILSFDDYGWSHVFRTILCRRHKILSIGVQHSAGNGLYGAPQLAYVCFDRYLIFGDFYKEKFAQYWRDVDLVPFSYNRMDTFIRKWHAEGCRSTSDRKMFPADGKKNILITWPSIIDAQHFQEIFPNAAGILAFLREVDDLILDKANIFIRPKYKYGVTELQKIIGNNAIDFIADTSVTIADLASQVDLVIASNGSGVIAECSLLRTKVVTYDYFGWLRGNWLKYGAGMCLQSKEDLVHFLGAYVSGEPVEVDWEYLWQDMVYPNEGYTNETLRMIVEQVTPV